MLYNKNQEKSDYVTINFQCKLVYLPLGKVFLLFLSHCGMAACCISVAATRKHKNINQIIYFGMMVLVNLCLLRFKGQ